MLNVGVFTVIRVLKAKVNQNSSDADPVHFFGSGSTNPVFKIQIRIRLIQRRPDSTGSGSYLDMLFIQQNKQLLYGISIPNLNIL